MLRVGKYFLTPISLKNIRVQGWRVERSLLVMNRLRKGAEWIQGRFLRAEMEACVRRVIPQPPCCTEQCFQARIFFTALPSTAGRAGGRMEREREGREEEEEEGGALTGAIYIELAPRCYLL